MIRGTRHILAVSALALLSACASDYVSVYDEIRQRQTQPQAQQRPQTASRPGTAPAPAQAPAQTSDQSDLMPVEKPEPVSSIGTVELPPSTAARDKPGKAPASRKPEPAPQAAPAPKAEAATSNQTAAPAPTVHSVEGGTVTVKPGETLFAIARRTGAELRDLIVTNDLEPPYAVRSGQVLKVPAARYHVVQQGETGYSISRLYDTDLTVLARLNGLEPPYAVRVGQRLRLPAEPSSAGAPVAQTRKPAAPAKRADEPARPTAVASAKPAADADNDRSKPAPTVPVTPAVATSAEAPAAIPAAATASAAPIKPKPAAKPVPEPANFSGRFSWPLTGRILSGFGPKAGGLHNDGINIAVQQGATVRAAAPGIVAYAGNGLKGFGWLVLIKHGDGWVTAYAHNETLLVKRGDRVRGGEPIARAGATGAVDRPQLHFEIRRGRRAVNPLEHLPPSPLS